MTQKIFSSSGEIKYYNVMIDGMFLIIKEAKETILDFSQGNVGELKIILL